MTTTCPGQRLGANARSTYASKTAALVAPSTARVGPIPSKLMLESTVVFSPRLRGTEKAAIVGLSVRSRR